MLNTWMDAFKKTVFGEWVCYMDNELGVLVWYKPTNSDLEIRATPNWEDCGYTPIEMCDGDNFDQDKLDKFEFTDVNEYYEAMKPYLEKYENGTGN